MTTVSTEVVDIRKDGEVERVVSLKGKEAGNAIFGDLYDRASPRSIYSTSRSGISSDTEDGGIPLQFVERDAVSKVSATKADLGNGEGWDEGGKQEQRPKCRYHPGRIITGVSHSATHSPASRGRS